MKFTWNDQMAIMCDWSPELAPLVPDNEGATAASSTHLLLRVILKHFCKPVGGGQRWFLCRGQDGATGMGLGLRLEKHPYAARGKTLKNLLTIPCLALHGGLHVTRYILCLSFRLRTRFVEKEWSCSHFSQILQSYAQCLISTCHAQSKWWGQLAVTTTTNFRAVKINRLSAIFVFYKVGFCGHLESGWLKVKLVVDVLFY